MSEQAGRTVVLIGGKPADLPLGTPEHRGATIQAQEIELSTIHAAGKSRTYTPASEGDASWIAIAAIPILFLEWNFRDAVLLLGTGGAFSGAVLLTASLHKKNIKWATSAIAASPFVLASGYEVYTEFQSGRFFQGELTSLLFQQPLQFLENIGTHIALPGVLGVAGVYALKYGFKAAAHAFKRSRTFRIATALSTAGFLLSADMLPQHAKAAPITTAKIIGHVAPSADVAVVNANGVAIKEQPSLKGRIIRTFDKGVKVSIDGSASIGAAAIYWDAVTIDLIDPNGDSITHLHGFMRKRFLTQVPQLP